MSNIFKTIPAVSWHYLKENWFTWLLLAVAIVFVGASTDWGIADISTIFSKFWDPFLGIAGTLITLGLTFYYVSRQWKESLEKKLIVHFENANGDYIASCYNVNILPNGELRALGLQVGQQMLSTQQVKFNPSVVERTSARPLAVLGEDGKSKWIMMYEIIFKLTTNEYNGGSAYYLIWNINDLQKTEKIEQPTKTPFHVKHDNLITLMSMDDKSLHAYNQIENTAIKIKGKFYFLNSSVITDFGRYVYESINIDKAKNMVKRNEFISAIGHQASADVMAQQLGTNVECSRISIKMEVGDQAIVFKLKDRLDEGRIYTSAEMQNMETEWGLLTREL
jgi:hypothetical protein